MLKKCLKVINYVLKNNAYISFGIGCKIGNITWNRYPLMDKSDQQQIYSGL